MKIKTKTVAYDYITGLKKPKHARPRKPLFLLHALIRFLSVFDLVPTKFSYTKVDMEKAGEGPYLILMNHSSFIDLKIASGIFFPMPFNIVCTTDAFVGKALLMKLIGCIPTQKYVTDITLITDMIHALKKNKTSVLLYPEAGYTFDGCSVSLPQGFGRLIKKLGVPVITVITDGAFLRDPLYNGLQLRKVKVSAEVRCLISEDEIQQKSVGEIDAVIREAFSFDNFARQYENRIEVKEDFRADGLNRILYKCPNCLSEGKTEGKGTKLICSECGKEYEMDVYGRLNAADGNTEFPHIPDWYRWQRECVRKELTSGDYLLDTEVDIAILSDYKALYKVGSGRLIHDKNGFRLTGCDGKLEYRQPPLSSFSLNADYYWYEMGDIISIGNRDRLYYCFPKEKDIVTKARLATEELYKLRKSNKELKGALS